MIEAKDQASTTEQAPASHSSPFIVGTPQHFRWLHGIIKFVLLLNLMDAIFTLFWVKAGLAVEANILLQSTVNEHPIAFVTIKIALVSLGSLLLWKRRDHPLAVVGSFVVFLVYYYLLLYHLQYFSFIVRIILNG